MKNSVLLLGALLLSAQTLRADNPVIVHEWGTFTCLQDENGEAIGGINVDDEPVPDFVYGSQFGDVVSQNSVYGNFGLPPYSPYAGKSGPVPTGDPSVTMRLETPVLYIYPPKGQAPLSVPPLDVQVDFFRGILSQYYPWAVADKQLGVRGAVPVNPLDTTTSSLTWRGVRLGSAEKPVETAASVWTTPREVSAPLLEVHPKLKDVNGVVHDDAQVERFLFYRGVGHLDSPLFIAPNSSGREICWRDMDGGLIRKLAAGWMVEIRPDGRCAFQSSLHFEAVSRDADIDSFLPELRSFTEEDFKADGLAQLKSSMHEALVKEGLYPDEATAMLKTWELSYFKSPGLRFFYIVPRKWVDKVLPLKITGAPTEVTRVMIGRVELISDSQKAALARLAAGPSPDLAAIKSAASAAMVSSSYSRDQADAFHRGEKPRSDLGIAIPRPVQDYLSLGRFRDALIVHEQQQHPSVSLAQFIKDNQLTVAQ